MQVSRNSTRLREGLESESALRADKSYKQQMAGTLFFCPDILTSPILSEQESQHCVKVLRTREGDTLTVTDGKGFVYDCELVQAHPKQCVIAILQQTGIATEIGIDRFIPLLCSYSERKEIKTERLQKIAVAAMKQSMQAYLPGIESMVRFEELVSRPFEGRKFIAHCHDLPKKPLAQSYGKGENALILIGPEGDFSEEEVERAIGFGFEPVSMGETRLRSETAALVSMHTLHVINNI